MAFLQRICMLILTFLFVGKVKKNVEIPILCSSLNNQVQTGWLAEVPSYWSQLVISNNRRPRSRLLILANNREPIPSLDPYGVYCHRIYVKFQR